jgi:hypothetical protein
MSKDIRKYKVTKGMFYGLVFRGTIVGGRVWNEDTYGQSYPLEDCEVVNDT